MRIVSKQATKPMAFGSKRQVGQRPSMTNPSSSLHSSSNRSFSFSSTSTGRSSYSGNSFASMTSSSNSQEADEPPASQGSGGVDHDPFLDFGASVNVTDDLTRTYNAEIDEIKEGNKKTQEDIDKEQNKEACLKKDAGHANDELDLLTQKARDLQAAETVHDNMRSNFQADIRRDLIAPLSSKGEPSDENSTDWTSKVFLQRKGQQMEELRALTDPEPLAKIQAECQEIQKEIDVIERTIIEENLEGVLEQKKQENEAIGRELHEERKRRQEMQATIDGMRKNTAQYAQQITDRQKILDANRKKYADEVESKKQELERAQADVRSLKTKEQWQKELEEAELERKKVASVLEEAQRMIEAYSVAIEERRAIESAMEELKASEKELQDKVADRKKALEASEELLAESLKEKEQAESKKLDNDKYEVEYTLKAKDLIVALGKDRENVSKKIAETDEFMSEESEEAAKEEDGLTIRLDELQKETKGLNEQIQEKEKELEEIKKSEVEESTRHENTIRDMEDLRKSLVGATETQEATLHTGTKEHEEKVAGSKSALEETIETRMEKDRHLQIVTVGVQLLAKKQEEVVRVDEAWKRREPEILDGENLEPTAQRTPEQIQEALDDFVAQSFVA